VVKNATIHLEIELKEKTQLSLFIKKYSGWLLDVMVCDFIN